MKLTSHNSIKIIWIGQGGFIFRTSNGKTILVDPYLPDGVKTKEGLKRLQKIFIKPEDIAADLVLCTHDHLE